LGQDVLREFTFEKSAEGWRAQNQCAFPGPDSRRVRSYRSTAGDNLPGVD
jgi:hypothetical protein